MDAELEAVARGSSNANTAKDPAPQPYKRLVLDVTCLENTRQQTRPIRRWLSKSAKKQIAVGPGFAAVCRHRDVVAGRNRRSVVLDYLPRGIAHSNTP